MTNTDTASVDELHAKRETLHKELQHLSEQISGSIAELKEKRDQRNALTAKAQEQKIIRKDLSAVIKEQIGKVKALRQQRGTRPVQAERGESPRVLRETIERIEHKIETSAMDFTQEQKLTKILKEKKVALAKIVGSSDLDREIRALSKEIDKLKKQSDEAHDLVTVSAKESQAHHERILTLSQLIEECKAREVVVKDEYLAVKAALQKHAPAQELPAKRSRSKKPTAPTEHSAEDEAMLKEKAAQVEEKVKSKQKLTTEDLLAFQSQKD